MKSIKITDTTRFSLKPFENRDAVSVYIVQKDGTERFLTVLWEVAGTNAVADYCNAVTDSIKAFNRARNIETYYNATNARVVRSKHSG